jgi:hypothetical protein
LEVGEESVASAKTLQSIATSDYSWLAEDATVAGGVVTALPAFTGGVPLPKTYGPGNAFTRESANLNGRITMPANTQGAYSATLWDAAPAAVTIASVYRTTGVNGGFCSLVTAGGAANTGVSQIRANTAAVISQKITTRATHNVVSPANCAHVSVFDASGITSYMNARTAVTTALASAVAGTRFTVGALDPGGTWAFLGEWALTAVWPRALTSGEVATLLAELGAFYGITIGA